MGTSSARQAPTGRLWRLAKGAATRYLSPESAGAVEAREVAARYLAALGEGRRAGDRRGPGGLSPDPEGGPESGGLLLPGRFRGLAGGAGPPGGSTDWPEEPSARAQALGTALGDSGGGLEQAVAHTALVGVWLDLPAPGAGPAPEAATVVRRFLAAAFHLRLALDLGESLEAAAAGFSPLRQGLKEIAARVGLAAEAARPETAAPLLPQHWLGLPGWTWVTQLLADLLAQLSDQGRV